MELLDDKYYSYFRFLYWWYVNPDRIDRLRRICSEKKWKKIAIYGMGAIGELVLNDLKKIGADAVYAIDRDPDSVFVDHQVYSLDDELPLMDIIIVTPFLQYNNIGPELEKVAKTKTISVLDLIV